jgi:hypothetical protein
VALAEHDLMNNIPRLTWDDIFTARRGTARVLPEDASNAEDALSRLRSLFGESLMDCSPILLDIVINQSPWTYQWITWLDGALTRLAAAKGHSGVLNRLKSRDTFDEALTVFQIAERLHAAGFEISFERPVKIGENEKVPDLDIYDPATHAHFFGEVSVLYNADVDVNAGRALDRLHYGLISLEGENLAVCGRIYAPESEIELNAVVDRLLWETMEVKRDLLFREVNIDALAEFAMAPQSQKNFVDDWARARGWEPGAYGISSQSPDPLLRFRSKVQLKVEQLPLGLPNILVIPGQGLFLAVDDPIELIPALKAVAAEFTQIGVLVVATTSMASSGWQRTEYDGAMFSRSERDGQGNQFLLVANEACPTALPPGTLDKIKLAFSI